MTANIDGYVTTGFEGVRDAFLRNFTEHGDIGAAFSLYVEGRKVADLWGGTADPSTKRPYEESTLQLVFSSTKGATAICANLLAQRGLLDVDEPVARYWPEFARAGKEAIPVRWLLSHQAGLPTIDEKLTFEQLLAWDPIIRALEDQRPLWEPGSAHGYHALTFGYLVGEVVRRVTGQRLAQFFADEITGPLDLEFWIGLPEAHEDRVAPIVGGIVPKEPDPQLRQLLEQFAGPDTMLGRALSLNGAIPDTSYFNRRDLHAAEMPAANGITNARSLARMYAGVFGSLDGSAPILKADQIEAARQRQTYGHDQVLFFKTRFGLGFFLASPFAPYGSSASLGHSGAGGSVGFADPEHQLGFGYVMNKMSQNLAGDPRSQGLVRASYDAIGVEPTFV